MKKKIEVSVFALVLLFGLTNAGLAQHGSARGKVISPQSNIERPGDIGVRAHTNIELLLPSGGFPVIGPSTSPAPGFVAETPASLAAFISWSRHAYQGVIRSPRPSIRQAAAK